MMPYRVKLTVAGEKATPIFVTLENVTLLEPRNYGTRIVFVGSDGDRAPKLLERRSRPHSLTDRLPALLWRPNGLLS